MISRLCLALCFLSQAKSITTKEWIRNRVTVSASEGGFLWGLGWGLGEGQLAVVDHEPIITHPSRLAYFGGHIPSPGVLGYLIPLSSFTFTCPTPKSPLKRPPFGALGSNSGCPTLCPSSPKPKNESWYALVQRGECTFAEKAREAQRLGAKAIVVGGLEGSGDDLASMYSPDAGDITIPATYISYNSYVNLTALIELSETTTSGLKTVSVLLTSDPTWEWYSPILTFLILLLLPSSLTLCTLIVHRIRMARAARLDRAPEEFVNSLPARVWTGTSWEKEYPRQLESGERSGETNDASTSNLDDDLPHPRWFLSQVECAICLSTFEVGDRVRILPCGHIFHLEEIDGWLIQRKKLCPVCKADVTINSNAHKHGIRFEPPVSPPARRSSSATTEAMSISTYTTTRDSSQQPNPSNSASTVVTHPDETTPLLGR